MPTHSERLQELRARAKRLKAQATNSTGSHFEQSAELSTGETQAYHFIGIKNPGDFRDQIVSLLITVWSFKDHFEKLLIEKGVSKSRARNLVWRAIRKSRDLKICLDLANDEKHSGLDSDGWSHLKPELGTVSFSIPGESLDKLVFAADGSIVTSVARPEDVLYSVSVIGQDGSPIGDATLIIERSLSVWEDFEKMISTLAGSQ